MARNDPRRELIDVRSAAVLVQRHPDTVRRWVRSGRLPAQRQGNLWQRLVDLDWPVAPEQLCR